MVKIFIYGAPGAGKSATSRYLKLLLNYPLVEGDYIKECIARLAKTELEDPFLYISTKEAWQKFGSFNKENVLKGMVAMRASIKPFLDNEITLYPQNLILEGPFLDPAYARQGKAFLIVTADESKHREQFFTDRPVTKENEKSFLAARILQDYLAEEANQYGIAVVANTDNPRVLAKSLAKRCAA